MQIRTKLTLRFSLIVAAILLLSSFAVYYFSADYREEDFYKRLKDSAMSTARLFLEVDEVDENLMRIIGQNINSLYDQHITIYNYLNEKIYDSRAGSDSLKQLNKEILNKVRLEKEIRFEIEKREYLGLLYTDRYNRFVVISSAYDKYGWRKIENLRLVLIVVMVVAMIITVIAGWFNSVQALKPINKVVEEVDAITERNLYSRVDEGNGSDEIAKLAITFNNMLSRLEDAFNMQKSFVSNASHELRTPLTAMSGQIEVSLMKNRSEEEYKRILRSVLEETRSMANMTNRLLDMAKASSDLSGIRFEKLRIDDLLWQAREDLISRNEGYSVSIQFEEMPEEESKLIVSGNENLLDAAFYNLMENACKYSKNHSVKAILNVSNNHVEVVFRDQGRGISPADLERIFEPFYRAYDARDVKGHGLGLSLTQKIIQLHNGYITITSEEGKGTTVHVELPFAS